MGGADVTQSKDQALTFDLPARAATRQQAAADIAAHLPVRLEGATVIIDGASLVVAAPSYIDETLKLLADAGVERVELHNVSERATRYLNSSADRRSVRALVSTSA